MDKLELADKILKHLYDTDPYNDNCDHVLQDLSRKIAQSVINSHNNAVKWCEERGYSIESGTDDLISQMEEQIYQKGYDAGIKEQREKDALIIDYCIVNCSTFSDEQMKADREVKMIKKFLVELAAMIKGGDYLP